MQEKPKTGFVAAGVGCAVTVAPGILCAAIGYALSPGIPDGGYYGALADVALTFCWCVGGFSVGLFMGILSAAFVSKWV